MIRKILLTLFLLLSMTSSVVAQVLVVRPFPFTRQLFTNEVYNVYQDRDGYVWLGTTAGLERWDGYRLRPFRSTVEHPDLLADNHIRNLDDTPDLLWIATDQGLSLYDKSNGKLFEPEDERLRRRRVSGMQSDASGGMWIAIGQRLYHCNSTCSEVKEINPFSETKEGHDIFDIYLDRENALWVMCREGILLRSRAGGFEQLPPLPNGGSVCTMFQDRERHYWMGTRVLACGSTSPKQTMPGTAGWSIPSSTTTSMFPRASFSAYAKTRQKGGCGCSLTTSYMPLNTKTDSSCP